MDHDQNQGPPLTSLMNWDRNGELRSDDLESLLKRLQAQDINSQRQEATATSRLGIQREHRRVKCSPWGIRP